MQQGEEFLFEPAPAIFKQHHVSFSSPLIMMPFDSPVDRNRHSVSNRNSTPPPPLKKVLEMRIFMPYKKPLYNPVKLIRGGIS
jgi:hypothetical protein